MKNKKEKQVVKLSYLDLNDINTSMVICTIEIVLDLIFLAMVVSVFIFSDPFVIKNCLSPTFIISALNVFVLSFFVFKRMKNLLDSRDFTKTEFKREMFYGDFMEANRLTEDELRDMIVFLSKIPGYKDFFIDVLKTKMSIERKQKTKGRIKWNTNVMSTLKANIEFPELNKEIQMESEWKIPEYKRMDMPKKFNEMMEKNIQNHKHLNKIHKMKKFE